MTSRNPITYIQWTAFDDSMSLAIFRGKDHKSYHCHKFSKDYNVITRLRRMIKIGNRFMLNSAHNIREFVLRKSA